MRIFIVVLIGLFFLPLALLSSFAQAPSSWNALKTSVHGSNNGSTLPYIYYLPFFPNRFTHLITPTITLTGTATETPPYPIITGEYPDLIPNGYSIQYYGCAWGSPGQVSTFVINSGRRNAGAFLVDIKKPAGKVVLIEGLEVQATAIVNAEFEKGPASEYWVEVDSDHQVQELNEANNIFHIMFTPPPECKPTATVTPVWEVP